MPFQVFEALLDSVAPLQEAACAITNQIDCQPMRRRPFERIIVGRADGCAIKAVFGLHRRSVTHQVSQTHHHLLVHFSEATHDLNRIFAGEVGRVQLSTFTEGFQHDNFTCGFGIVRPRLGSAIRLRPDFTRNTGAGLAHVIRQGGAPLAHIRGIARVFDEILVHVDLKDKIADLNTLAGRNSCLHRMLHARPVSTKVNPIGTCITDEDAPATCADRAVKA